MRNESGKWITRYSTRGHPYEAWEPAMPRIPDGALNQVIYLYPSVPDAETGARTGGSGFLVMLPSVGLGSRGLLIAVTNAHVIEAGSTVVRINTADGKFDTFDFSDRDWIFHPNKDDVAVCCMPSLNPDLHAFAEITEKQLLKKSEIGSFNIGPGDDAFVVGRFINAQGKLRNIPSVRFGNIAQMPVETIEQDRDFGKFQQESFLVEARSISGYSGSPVFLILHASQSRQREGLRLDTDLFRLLGIQWGYIQDFEPVLDANGAPVPSGQKVRLNTGLMGVVPAWKLADLLRDDKVMAAKKRAEDEYIRKHGLPTTALANARNTDVSESDANPDHLKAFTRLVDVAARKKPRD
jgi:hypothetical protein